MTGTDLSPCQKNERVQSKRTQRLSQAFLTAGGSARETDYFLSFWFSICPLLGPQRGGDTLVCSYTSFVISTGTLAIGNFNPDVKQPYLCGDFSLFVLGTRFFQFSPVSHGFLTLYVIYSQISHYYGLKWSIGYSEPPSLPLNITLLNFLLHISSMGQQFAIQAPRSFIKGEGGHLELIFNTKYDHLEDSYVYLYDSQTLSEIYRTTVKPVRQRLSLIIPDIFPHSSVGRSYIAKWYKNQGFFSELLHVSNPIEVTDYTTMLKKSVQEQTKKVESELFKQQVDFECKISALKDELAQARAENNNKKRPRPSPSASITTQERQIFRKYFDEIDTDLDGQISPKELQIYLDTKNIHCNNTAIQKMMDEADLDMNGTLSVDEFILVLYQADEAHTNMSNGWRLAQQQIRAEIADSSPRVRQAAAAAAADVPVASAKAKANDAIQKRAGDRIAQMKKGKK